MAHEFKHPKYYKETKIMAKYDNIDKAIYDAPNTKERIKLASEPDEFEVIELPSLIEAFEEWKKNNTGTFKDFLNDNPSKRKKLQLGGRVRLGEGGKGESSFEQLADDWLDGIRVIYVDGVKEEFSAYVKRMGGVYDID